MPISNDDILAELMQHAQTGEMSIGVFIELNTMTQDRRMHIYQMFEAIKMLEENFPGTNE